jgi:hypothetical protein
MSTRMAEVSPRRGTQASPRQRHEHPPRSLLDTVRSGRGLVDGKDEQALEAEQYRVGVQHLEPGAEGLDDGRPDSPGWGAGHF